MAFSSYVDPKKCKPLIQLITYTLHVCYEIVRLSHNEESDLCLGAWRSPLHGKNLHKDFFQFRIKTKVSVSPCTVIMTCLGSVIKNLLLKEIVTVSRCRRCLNNCFTTDITRLAKSIRNCCKIETDCDEKLLSQ